MGIIPKSWNKAVQKNGGLFKTAKSIFKEEGLITNAREEALTSMEKKANLKFKDSMGAYESNAANTTGAMSANSVSGAQDMRNTKKGFTKEYEKNVRDFDPDTMTDGSPWKNATKSQKARTMSMAVTNATLSNPSASLSNADELLGLYNSALTATKRKANVIAAGNAVKNYYTKPFEDGRIGTGIARAGVTAAKVGSAGAITYSLSGAGNKSYSGNNGNGSYDY